ncbi:MAG: hypothetical protein AAGC93_29940, partial [Cyanobacteria bacterium P01_F01_bin.53]
KVEQNLTRMDNEFYHESHYQAGLVISLNLLWCGSFLQLQSIFARLQLYIGLSQAEHPVLDIRLFLVFMNRAAWSPSQKTLSKVAENVKDQRP